MKARNLFCLFLGVLLLASFTELKANDSPEVQMKDKASDAKKDYNKTVRKAKKKVRKATGENSPAKDAKDKLEDAGDELKNTQEKIEHRVQD